MQMLFKISPWAFTHVSHAPRWHRHCPIAAVTCLWSSSAHTEPANVSTHRYLLCVTVCLVYCLLHDTLDRIVNKIKVRWVQGHTSGGMKSSVSVHCATAWLTSCVTSCQVKASHRWWVCNKLYHAEITPEQGASKIGKIFKQMAKLSWNLKWLLFFSDTVYIICTWVSDETKCTLTHS